MNASLFATPAPALRAGTAHPLSPMPSRLALLAFALLTGLTALARIPEPGTVFYGKIVNRTSGQEFVLTEGTIYWTLTKPDGARILLLGKLEDFGNGECSYRMTVPHEALALGLTVSTSSVPLTAQPGDCSHVRILVNGLPALILAPGSQSFQVSQHSRAATHRLDLEMFDALPDSDGDGIPDWWENQYGLDRFNAGDGAGDRDGDGLSNLAEFKKGTDPDQSNLTPSLATRSLLVYAGGKTSLRLKAADADSQPGSLIYTLLQSPSSGSVVLRNTTTPAAPSERILEAGATFTQAEINRGCVIFTLEDGAPSGSSPNLQLSVRDEDPTHAAATGSVALVIYRPSDGVTADVLTAALAGLPAATVDLPGISESEQQKLANYLLSRDLGYIIADASAEGGSHELAVPSSDLTPSQYETEYIPSYGPDRPHVLLGGALADTLAGSMEDDVLIGGPGNDRLRGNGGRDLFTLLSQQDGNDVIEDFNTSDGDALELSRVLTGSSDLLSDYVRISAEGSNAVVGIHFNGLATGDPDMIVTFSPGIVTPGSLHDLFENDNLIARGKRLPGRVTILTTITSASENGPAEGEVTVTRTGATDSALAVNLSVTGSAANGIDYQFVASPAIIPAGARSVAVPIRPYPDAITELAEIVEVRVEAGSEYDLGTAITARVTIEDLAPLISIEALEPVAEKASQMPGMYLVTRSGVVDRSVFVRLQVSGTASNGVDYSRINSYVNLAAWQTSDLILIAPRTNAVLQGGAESVVVTVKPDATYKTGNPASARVMIVEEMLTLARWQEKSFPGWTGDLDDFASADPGGHGIVNALRYAFGLDAQNPASGASRDALPRAVIVDQHLCVTFRRPTAVTDLDYVVEVSTDLQSWSSVPGAVEQVLLPIGSADAELQCYRAVAPMTEASAQFLRVLVIRRP